MKLLISNKKVNFNYTIIDSYEAGIELKGNEVKSIIKGEVNINESFVIFKNEEAFLINMYIAPFKQDNKFVEYIATRRRKLLLHKSQIKKLQLEQKKFKYSIIPESLYKEKKNIKLKICLCKHKKMHDKREKIKERDLERLL